MADNKEKSTSESEGEIMRKIKRITTFILILLIMTLYSIPSNAKNVKYETYQESLGYYTITGYCPCSYCCGKSDGVTASGTIAQANHTIAADTSILPFGTEVIINGQRYIVEDVGGAINGNHIDMFFASHQEALNWGRQTIEVFVERTREVIEEKEEKEEVIKLDTSTSEEELNTMIEINLKEYQYVIGEIIKNEDHYYTFNTVTKEVLWQDSNERVLARKVKVDGDDGFKHYISVQLNNKYLRGDK